MCGKRVESQYDLSQLMKSYATTSIKDVCKDCEKEINSHLWKVRELYEPLVCRAIKKYMRYRRIEKVNDVRGGK
jgi:hypothetical protein